MAVRSPAPFSGACARRPRIDVMCLALAREYETPAVTRRCRRSRPAIDDDVLCRGSIIPCAELGGQALAARDGMVDRAGR